METSLPDAQPFARPDLPCYTVRFHDHDHDHAAATRRSISCDFEPVSSRKPSFDPNARRSSVNKSRRSASHGCLRQRLLSPSTMRFRSKEGRTLQLPPFESLGIAIPSLSSQPTLMKQSQEGRESQDSVNPPPLVTDVASLTGSTSPEDSSGPFASNSYPSSAPITPPDYEESVRWEHTQPANLQREKSPINTDVNPENPTRQSTPGVTPIGNSNALHTGGDKDEWLRNGYAAAGRCQKYESVV